MSRYYDYDYDRNCIICFGSDDTDTDSNADNISSTSSQSGDSFPNLSPASSLSGSTHNDSVKDEYERIERDDDILYILPADHKSTQSLNLVPIKFDVPFILVSDLIKQYDEYVLQPITATIGDNIDPNSMHHQLLLQRHTMNVVEAYESIRRMHDFNGSYYNAFGCMQLRQNTFHVWRFQIFGHSPSIIGIIEADATQHDLNGAYFGCNKSYSYSFNTITAQCYSSMTKQQPIYQHMLQNGVLDSAMIIDVALDLYRGTMTITNKTHGSEHFGKEILLFSDINTQKTYKLAIAQLGPETINLF